MSGLIIDLFAGGGGVSTGIKMALGRSPDIAINHDQWAVAMHAENHPETLHICQNICQVQPTHVVQGRPVSLLWASPDCKHFSNAKGSKPCDQNIRDLAWTIIKWAEQVRPKIIFLENVKEFQDWGPLGKDDKPIPEQKGAIFRAWVRRLKRAGYRVQCRVLRCCDYGAPTSRKRFFLIARCDGLPIIWPESTHGKGKLPYRTAAECIDWNEPACSIYATKEEALAWAKLHGKGCPRRPLASNTMKRIARGVQKFVIKEPNPFIVENFIPTIIQMGYGEREGQKPRVPGANKPLGTVTAGGNKFGLVVAHLERQFGQSIGASLMEPAPTIMANGGGKIGLDMVYMQKMRGTNLGGAANEPLHTISAGGQHHALTVAHMMAYYSSEKEPVMMDKPLRTVVTKDRFGLVMVKVNGESYVITDILMRMLTPRELYRAQGFPDSYIIDRAAGERLNKGQQVKMVGNSVPPPMAAALIKANCDHLDVDQRELVSMPLLEAA